MRITKKEAKTRKDIKPSDLLLFANVNNWIIFFIFASYLPWDIIFVRRRKRIRTNYASFFSLSLIRPQLALSLSLSHFPHGERRSFSLILPQMRKLTSEYADQWEKIKYCRDFKENSRCGWRFHSIRKKKVYEWKLRSLKTGLWWGRA